MAKENKVIEQDSSPPLRFLQSRDPELQKKRKMLLRAKKKYFSEMEKNILSEDELKVLRARYQRQCTGYVDLFVKKLRTEKAC